MASWGVVKKAIVGGIALGLSGCGTGAEPQENTSSVRETVTGGNTFTWTTPGSPWGAVGMLNISWNDCPLLCPNGNPPSQRYGCGGMGGGSPTRQCSGKMVQCSGALIQRDLVLTAGHCFCDIEDPPAKEVTQITFVLPGRSAGFEGGNFRWHVDDCEGSYEDDASADLAVVRLNESVPEAVANADLFKPYLSS